MNVSLFLVPSLGISLFCLFCPILVCKFLLYIFLFPKPTCFLMRQKQRWPWWEGWCTGVGKSRGKGNYNWDRLCNKKICFLLEWPKLQMFYVLHWHWWSEAEKLKILWLFYKLKRCLLGPGLSTEPLRSHVETESPVLDIHRPCKANAFMLHQHILQLYAMPSIFFTGLQFIPKYICKQCYNLSSRKSVSR